MKKSELLNLKEGVYLLTDSICNYVYELRKFDKENSLVCSVRERGSLSNNFLFVHYDLVQPYEDGYEKYIPIKQFSSNIHVGGLGLQSRGTFSLYELYLIGKYDPNTFREDFKRYQVHHVINLLRYDKKTYREIKLKRF